VPDEPLRAACDKVVSHLLERHGWQLLEKQGFARRLLARAQAAATEGAEPLEGEALTALAVNEYCLVWYEACRSQGSVQSRAFSELARYLYDRAVAKYGDPALAQEVAQDALVLVYEQIESCRNPGAFMAFALLKLWNAATSYFRRHKRLLEQSETLLAHEGGDEEAASEEAGADWVDRQPLPDAVASDSERGEAIMARVTELLHDSPRAHKQLLAVLYKFVHGYSDQEIAAALETDIAGVHVLRSRGLARLREDAQLRALAQEYL
jgi:RNA polymerase sigma factor (sigma-70 family)